jgi:hypothetical protein
MDKSEIKAVCAVVLLIFAARVHAVGETGAQFLKIGVGPRACAMGEAYAAVADDPTALFWNVAGLKQAKGIQLLGQQNFWFMDMSYQYVAGSFSTPFGGLGVGLAYSSSGKIPKYEDFERIGEYSAYDAAATLGYANSIAFLSYGISLKAIRQSIDSVNATGFAGDVGLIITPPIVSFVKAGIAVQNIGPGVKFISQADPMPLNIKGGVAVKLGPVLVAADVNKPIDNSLRVNAGAEVAIKNTLFLRGGYNTANSFSAGVGLKFLNLAIDYAFTPYKDINPSHRISLLLSL